MQTGVLKKILSYYKMPVFLALTIFVVMVGARVERDILNILWLLFGSLLGVFTLDLDYVLHAYFLEPTNNFSQSVRGYIGHKDIAGFLTFVHFHKNDLQEKTLNSALFQIVLGALMLFVVSSNANVFVKALVLSTFVNSMYRMSEYYFEGKITDWFWAIKVPLDAKTFRKVFYVYCLLLLGVLIFSIGIL